MYFLLHLTLWGIIVSYSQLMPSTYNLPTLPTPQSVLLLLYILTNTITICTFEEGISMGSGALDTHKNFRIPTGCITCGGGGRGKPYMFRMIPGLLLRG